MRNVIGEIVVVEMGEIVKRERKDQKWRGILALDPGGVTGASYAVFPMRKGEYPRVIWEQREEAQDWSIEGDYRQQVKEIIGIYKRLTPQLLVVEQFDLRAQDFVADLTSVQICAGMMCALPAGTVDKHVRWQTPGQAKGYPPISTTEKMKEFGAWYVGSDHVRDARRHLVVAMARMCAGVLNAE